MSEKEDTDKPIDCVTEQEREYAQNALNEFDKYVYFDPLQFTLPPVCILEAISLRVYKI